MSEKTLQIIQGLAQAAADSYDGASDIRFLILDKSIALNVVLMVHI
jgi:hypothetical protein